MESYGTTAEADEYHAATGRSSWAAADPEARSAALFRASIYLDALYAPRYPGVKASISQVLGWPRKGAANASGEPIPDDSVPYQVRYSAYELAASMVENPSLWARDIDPLKVIKSETVGPISRTYAVGEVDAKSVQVVSPVVAGLMASVLFPEDLTFRFGPVVV